MFEKYIDSISKSLLFKNIDSENILEMLKCLKPKLKSYKKNDYIFMAGDPFKYLCIIIEGKAAVLKEKIDGERIIITMLKESDVFGEEIAFSSLDKWFNSVQAFEESKIIFFHQNKITAECCKVCPWHRSLIDNCLRLLSEKALMLDRKVEYLSIQGIRGKVSSYLYEQYGINKSTNFLLNLNRRELSDFLNIPRPSLSRELCKMRDEKVIDFHLKSFRILDIKTLKSMSSL
ncbi:MAG: Crp/Fnr family transcriptional regulator [Actinomycetota bacterium]|nr:Crp/Fnr family transcriptional regulator [Actinomycetota bacterium]